MLAKFDSTTQGRLAFDSAKAELLLHFCLGRTSTIEGAQPQQLSRRTRYTHRRCSRAATDNGRLSRSHGVRGRGRLAPEYEHQCYWRRSRPRQHCSGRCTKRRRSRWRLGVCFRVSSGAFAVSLFGCVVFPRVHSSVRPGAMYTQESVCAVHSDRVLLVVLLIL